MKSRRRSMISLEVIIVIIIACCMIFLINFTQAKVNEILITTNEALLIHHDPNNALHGELAEKIMEYRPDTCKMIEVFSEDFESVFRVQFRDDPMSQDDALTAHEELMKLLKSNSDGHTSVTIGDEEEDVYFQWVDSADNERYLVMIYMSRPVVENLWVISFICYLILILVGILLIRLMLIQRSADIAQYEKISGRACNKMLF